MKDQINRLQPGIDEMNANLGLLTAEEELNILKEELKAAHANIQSRDQIIKNEQEKLESKTIIMETELHAALAKIQRRDVTIKQNQEELVVKTIVETKMEGDFMLTANKMEAVNAGI